MLLQIRGMQFPQLYQQLLAQSSNKILKSWCFENKGWKYSCRSAQMSYVNTNFCLILYIVYNEGASSLPKVTMFFLKVSAISI